MKQSKLIFRTLLAGVLFTAFNASATVSGADAEKLKGELTPFGAQKAGNADGSIPAWTGGYVTPIPGDEPGGRRGDPFKDEKPLFSINAGNLAQHADKVTEGVQELLKKYPDSFRLDVYKTHRTAAAPQWVYDNTFANATRAKIDNGILTGAYGGIPFPIPQTGEEVMWNHTMRWRGEAAQNMGRWYVLSSDGRSSMISDTDNQQQFPYYYKEGNAEAFDQGNGIFWTVRVQTRGPAIRRGEAVLAHENVDPNKLSTWVYLTGQRRVRKLPNACCDTPTPAASGVMSFDELYVWTGRLDRFNWNIVGKKEMYIPYNSNRTFQPTNDEDIISGHHYNPDHMRWELHRVWVVDASLKDGQRHQAPKSRYYCDEDTWTCVLADRWDANGQLWKTLWAQPLVAPDLPGVVIGSYGYNDLLSGTGLIAELTNSQKSQLAIIPRKPETYYSPSALASDSLR